MAAGFTEVIVLARRQRAEAERDAEVGVSAQLTHQWQHDFAHRHGIFAGFGYRCP